jgi:hypothetical protein
MDARRLFSLAVPCLMAICGSAVAQNSANFTTDDMSKWSITIPAGTVSSTKYSIDGSAVLGWEHYQMQKWGEEWNHQWISPFSNSANRPAGTYAFDLKFNTDTSGLLAGAALLDIGYMADDSLRSIELNGQTIWTMTEMNDFSFVDMSDPDDFLKNQLNTSWFFTHATCLDTINIDLADGDNVLRFNTYNNLGSNSVPSLVGFTSALNITNVPEPTTTMLAGLAGLTLLIRRRRAA